MEFADINVQAEYDDLKEQEAQLWADLDIVRDLLRNIEDVEDRA